MKMRAGRLVEVGRMECEEVETTPPGEGQLLVRNEMASICGSDLHNVMMGVALPPFPQAPGFPGHEGIGIVEESHHPDFAAGDRVLTCPQPPESFCFADYQTLHGKFCVKLPADGESSHLLMAQQFGTVIFALRQHPVDVVGRTVMVMGQGSAGMFFAYLLKRAGAAKVIVSDLSAARLAISPGMGADVVLNAGSDDIRERVKAETGGEGVDFLVEAVGRRETFQEAPHLTRFAGTMLWFGLPDTGEPIPFDFAHLFRKKLEFSSTYGAQFEPEHASFELAVQLIRSGAIDVSPMVSHMLDIEQIDRAMHLAHERTENAIKVSIRLGQA